MKNRKNIYVVVCKNDLPFIRADGTAGKPDKNGEIILETYTKFASLINAKRWIVAHGQRLGKCRIAKLEFITEYDKK